MRPPAAWRSQVSFALDGEEVRTVSATEMVSWRDLRSSPTSLAIARRAGGRKLEFASVSCGAAIFDCASKLDSKLREGVQCRIGSFQISVGGSSKQMRISMYMFVITSICSLFLITAHHLRRSLRACPIRSVFHKSIPRQVPSLGYPDSSTSDEQAEPESITLSFHTNCLTYNECK